MTGGARDVSDNHWKLHLSYLVELKQHGDAINKNRVYKSFINLQAESEQSMYQARSGVRNQLHQGNKTLGEINLASVVYAVRRNT